MLIFGPLLGVIGRFFGYFEISGSSRPKGSAEGGAPYGATEGKRSLLAGLYRVAAPPFACSIMCVRAPPFGIFQALAERIKLVRTGGREDGSKKIFFHLRFHHQKKIFFFLKIFFFFFFFFDGCSILCGISSPFLSSI